MTGATFTIHRDDDPSGVSGTGVVAEGWESSAGDWVVLLWLSATPSLCVYRDVREVEAIHGHGGKTRIVWDTPHQYTPAAPPHYDNSPGFSHEQPATSRYEHDPIHDPRD